MKKPIKNTIIVTICFLVIMIGYSLPSNVKQRDAIKEFYKKKEAYEVIKDFMIKEMQGNETSRILIQKSSKGWGYIFTGSDRMITSKSYDILEQNVIDSLDLLSGIKETRFDFCGSGCVGNYKIIAFVYDWEYAYDRRYNIYWCEDIYILKLYIQGVKEYNLKKLGGNWYYVGFEL